MAEVTFDPRASDPRHTWGESQDSGAQSSQAESEEEPKWQPVASSGSKNAGPVASSGSATSMPSLAESVPFGKVNTISNLSMGSSIRKPHPYFPDQSDDWTKRRDSVDKNPLSQYMIESCSKKESLGMRIRRSLQWFYGVPHTQNFNLRQLRIKGTTDGKFKDIVQNLMNVRCSAAADLDDVSTMLRDTRQPWSFFDIVEADVKRELFWVLCHFSILGQMIATSMAMIAFCSFLYCSTIVFYDPVLQFDEDLNPSTDTYQLLQRFDIALDVLFFFGTLTELRTTFIDTDHFVETCEPAKIWWKTVLSISFWIDIVSCFPAFFVYAFPSAPLQLLLVKVCTRLRCTIVWLLDMQNYSQLLMQAYWLQILRLILLIILLGHGMGCIWYCVSTPLNHPLLEGAGGGKRWIYPWNADRPFFLYYTYFSKTGLYLALGIIVQGYSLAENALIVVLAPLGSVISALILSAIIVLVSRKTALETHTLEQVENLKQAISTQGLPPTIQLRLMAYHTQKRVHRCREETEHIFRGLSSQLHFELNLVLYCNLLIEAEIFKKSHPRVIRQIVLVFEDKLFLPGDYVCRYDDEGSEMYFIFKGMVGVYSDAFHFLCHMKKGQHFGEVALLTGQRRTAYVQAKMFCMLASLSKANFDNIMREYPQQYDVIMQQMTAKKRQWMQSLVKQQREKDIVRQGLVKRSWSMVSKGRLGDQGGEDDLDDVETNETMAKSALRYSRSGSMLNEDDQAPKGRRISFSDEVKGGKEMEAGEETGASKSSGHVTMVIPFCQKPVAFASESSSKPATGSSSSEDSQKSSDDEKDSDDEKHDSDGSEDTEEPRDQDQDSDGDSDEDIEALVRAVSKRCSTALQANERVCTRLKEITQRQAANAGKASQLGSTFENYCPEETSEDRTEMLECLCNDVDNIQRAIKECTDLESNELDTAYSHHVAMGVLDQQENQDDQEIRSNGTGQDFGDRPSGGVTKVSSLPSNHDAERTVL